MNKQVDTVDRAEVRLIDRKLPFRLAAVLLGLFLFAAALAAPKPFPRPTGYVNDFAHVVDEASSARIMAICRELGQKTGAQIAVASFPDMGGEEIDGFTNRLFDEWMPGQKGVNNGILIVNAIAERKARIEVGYGLEPLITDAVTGRIRRDIMNPLLQSGKYGEAYLSAVASLASIIAKDQNVTLSSLSGVDVPDTRGEGRAHKRGFPLGLLIPIGLFLLISLSRSNRFRGGGGPFIGGPFIGGGFGGGGWGGGGGGFGGFGGGMSGGGGSSGGY